MSECPCSLCWRPSRSLLSRCWGLWVTSLVVFSGILPVTGGPAFAAEAQWVWYPERDPSSVAAVSRYFRKTFSMSDPVSGLVEITCDDAYQLWVNGQRVGGDKDVTTLEEFEIGPYLRRGKNVVSVRAQNLTAGSPAGLAVRLIVKDAGHTEVTHSSDKTWKTNSYGPRGWSTPKFNDVRWTAARELGPLGGTLPWRGKVKGVGGGSLSRFTTPPGFHVEQVVPPEKTGSVVAIAFNERGDLIISRERGPLLMARHDDEHGLEDQVSLYADQITDCQGILPLNGMVFAVGRGPDGPGLCRLRDADQDGTADECSTLMKFEGGMTEHGPHCVVLGPEGLIYVALGNHARCMMPPQPSSPYHHFYEGDLLRPRYEDPGGHANGIRAPGGTVIRTDASGTFCEVFCGGLRNHYDMAFHRSGELLTVDSDMEWDAGLPWYRPARVHHLIPGGEYGWRSGWAKWPQYFADNLPPVHEMGRGSPAGVTFYHHHRLPQQYRGALLVCDWSQGQILAVYPLEHQGSFQATSDVLVEGRPLNATDIAVGPDGWVYFATGGRGTEGGIYRLTYDRSVPAPPPATGIAAAVRQPQLQSAWGRDQVARIRLKMGKRWTKNLVEFISDTSNNPSDRARGLDFMQLVGPFPSHTFLAKLASDPSPIVRAKAAYLMGIHANEQTAAALTLLIEDADPMVVRVACESLVRARQQAPLDKLFRLLEAAPQPVRFAAIRLLQATPQDRWEPTILTSENPSTFIWGSMALLPLVDDDEVLEGIIARSRHFLRGYLTDQEFLGLLRVLQLTLLKGPRDQEALLELSADLAEEYPAGDPRMNRELVRLLVHLQETSVVDRLIAELVNDAVPLQERLHLASCLRFLQTGWTTEQKTTLLAFYEAARLLDGGESLARYLDNIARDFLANLSPRERGMLLARGAKMPGMALQVLRSCPKELSEAQVDTLLDLDISLAGRTDRAAQELATGLMAVLGQSSDEHALDYIRSLFDEYPERRSDVAMVLSTRPTDELEEAKLNWPLLIRALPPADSVTAEMILEALAKIRLKPVKSEPTRQVILAGLRLGDEGGHFALEVLRLWHRRKLATPGDRPLEALAKWQDWFAQNFPESPPATLPVDDPNSRWHFEELADFLTSEEGLQGDWEYGRDLFINKGRCAACHRHGSVGERTGPDLSRVGSRFQRVEILESILFPSQVISDQYQSRTVVTTDGKVVTGILGSGGTNSVVVLTPSGKKVEIPKSEIEDIGISRNSAMPDGLLDHFTEEEIADLFFFLTSPPEDSP